MLRVRVSVKAGGSALGFGFGVRVKGTRGKARQVKTRQDNTRQDKVMQHKTIHLTTKENKTI